MDGLHALYALGSVPLNVSLALFYLVSVGQAAHIAALVRHAKRAHFVLTVVYETFMLIHVFLCVVVIGGVVHGQLLPLSIGGPLSIFPLALLWLNVISFVVGITLLFYTKHSVLLVDAVFLIALTPAGVAIADIFLPWLMFAEMLFVLFRTVYRLALDIQTARQSVSRAMVYEALKRLPEGVMYADASGCVVLMNDRMRSCLAKLSIPAGRADIPALVSELEEKSDWGALQKTGCTVGKTDSDNSAGSQRDLADWTKSACVQVSGGETWFFDIGKTVANQRRYWRVMAYDVTEQCRVERDFRHMDDMLETANTDLHAVMENVLEIARHEAIMHARSRIHDVIGQRISLLHRCLEDRRISDEELERLRPFLITIADDLVKQDNVNCREELDSIVSAFSLVGVTVNVMGPLPDTPREASVFVHVAREAITNAVKHAQATCVNVAFEKDSDELRMTVNNNGVPFSGEMHEGTGIRGMRHVTIEAGGQFSLRLNPLFIIEVVFPVRPVGKGIKGR